MCEGRRSNRLEATALPVIQWPARYKFDHAIRNKTATVVTRINDQRVLVHLRHKAFEQLAVSGYRRIRREVRFGKENSRVDLLLEDGGALRSCYLEVKNVTAAVNKGIGFFPDAVSTRGTRHPSTVDNR